MLRCVNSMLHSKRLSNQSMLLYAYHMTEISQIYPITDLLDSGHLDVGDGHHVYWQTQGNPDGVPIVLVHGGPGSGMSSSKPSLLNPEHYYIISVDQRGCGQSTPSACLEHNTTQHLVADMEVLRGVLKIDQWIVFGGSWGSTVALLYACTHPQSIKTLVINGIYLVRPMEHNAVYAPNDICAQIYPDLYQKFMALLPEDDRKDPLKGYAKLFQSSDQVLRKKALIEWSMYEYQLMTLLPTPRLTDQELEDGFDHIESSAKIMMHYFLNDGFIDGDALLATLGDRLKDMPVHIVQGRYDLVCPMITAWQVHQAIPQSVLHIIDDAGHRTKESGITKKLLEIFNTL